MQQEIWKDAPNYEGLYKVSNLGRVMTIRRSGTKGCILKEQITKDGYNRISLSKNGNYKKFPIHRLVAMAFIPNPDNLPIINHKNEIRNDNRVENLEWCNYSYNATYGGATERRIKNIIKPIVCFDSNGIIIAEFKSVNDAERETHIHHSNIVACLKGRRKIAGGFKWNYKN